MWAYPKASKHYEDSIVCCIKYNPEPAVFPISCDGVQPELEVDKKVIQFEKVLLHRYTHQLLINLPSVYNCCAGKRLEVCFCVIIHYYLCSGGLVDWMFWEMISHSTRSTASYNPSQSLSSKFTSEHQRLTIIKEH